MQRNLGIFIATTGVALLSSLPTAIAHGHDENIDGNMDGATHSRPVISSPASNLVTEPLGTYFQYGEHSQLIFAHILLMILGWVFVLPVGRWTP